MTLASSNTNQIVPSDFRLFLQKELIRRCQKNPAYSLRAFSKTLGVHHAALSLMLRNKRKITNQTKKKFAKALGLSPFELQLFSSDDGTIGFDHLAIDTFEAISDWYHDALLELTRVKSFKTDRSWISKVLGISKTEVNAAVERLQRLGMLKITPAGKWIDLSKDNSTTNDFTSAALRKLQKCLLEKAMTAIEDVPKPRREHASMMMAVSTKDLPEVKILIQKFSESLCRRLQRKNVSANHVYQLCVAFFPLTKNIEEIP